MLAGGECRLFLQLFNASTVNSLLTATPLSDHFVKTVLLSHLSEEVC